MKNNRSTIFTGNAPHQNHDVPLHTIEFHAADLLKTIEEPFFTVNSETWEIVYANKKGKELLGLKNGARKKPFWQIIKNDKDYPLFKDNFLRAIQQRKSVQFEVCNPFDMACDENEGDKWYLVNLFPSKLSAVLMLDITERKKTEEELEKYYNAVEQTEDAVFLTDVNGIIKYINPAFEKLTGFSEREAIGKTPKIVHSGYNRPEQYKSLWETIKRGEHFKAILINKKKNGDLFYADHIILPLKDEEGKVKNFVAIWRDITEQIEVEKRREDFINTAGHEIKTPLTVLKIYTNALRKGVNEKRYHDLSRYSGLIDQQINRLTDIVEDLLDVSRLQSGRYELHKTYFSMGKLVRDVAKNITDTTDRKITVTVRFNSKIHADKSRISQVIINLLTNAVKYSDDDKRILVKVFDKSSDAVVRVIDNGIGINKRHLDKLFTRFYRANEKNLKTVTGLGMGLYISKQIVEKHNGKIWVESQIGKGSTFYFSIPKK